MTTRQRNWRNQNEKNQRLLRNRFVWRLVNSEHAKINFDMRRLQIWHQPRRSVKWKPREMNATRRRQKCFKCRLLEWPLLRRLLFLFAFSLHSFWRLLTFRFVHRSKNTHLMPFSERFCLVRVIIRPWQTNKNILFVWLLFYCFAWLIFGLLFSFRFVLLPSRRILWQWACLSLSVRFILSDKFFDDISPIRRFRFVFSRFFSLLFLASYAFCVANENWCRF